MKLKQVVSVLFVLLSAVQVQSSSSSSSSSSTAIAEAAKLRQDFRDVNDGFVLLTAEANKGKEVDILRRIAVTGNETEYEKWKAAVKDEWIKAFLVYEAIEAQKFDFALKVFRQISTEAAEFKDIKKQMAEGDGNKFEWILLVLERAVHKVPSLTDAIKETVIDLRREIVRKIHERSLLSLGITSNVEKDIKDGLLIEPYTGLVNSFIHSAVDRQYYYSDNALKNAVIADKPGLVNLLLLNRVKAKAANLASGMTNLSALNLYESAKSPAMIRQLKKFQVPMLWTSKILRDAFEDIEPESKRSEMLNLLKITTEEEKKAFKSLYDGDDKMTVREAIMTKSWRTLMGIFMRDDVGEYQKDWFKLAIKFCGVSCFHALLDERVPFLNEKEFEDALNKWVVFSERQKFRKTWDQFKTFYKDNKCIDGPLGCDKDKYAAWVAMTKPTDDVLKNAVKDDKLDVIGTMIANYVKLKGGDPKSEDDVAKHLGKLSLYRVATSPEMVKKLKELKVPLVWDSLIIRSYISVSGSYSKYFEILNLIKLSTDGDKKRYKELYGGNDKMTVPEAIETKSWPKLDSVFLREDVGLYQKDWFKPAIKSGSLELFGVLLNERVPLLSNDEFEATLLSIKESDRQQFRTKLAAYSRHYKDGKCIDGPLGCDKDKYEAWLVSEGKFLSGANTGGATGGGGGGGGIGSTLIATQASECTPLA